MLTYNKFILLEKIQTQDQDDNIDYKSIIDNAYKHFKKLGIPINSLDILDYVETSIGKELDDNTYANLYYSITGEEIDSSFDLNNEEKYIVR
jgi:hypothetical protein